MKGIGQLLYTVVCVCTAMVGYEIHGSVFWSIMDFIFAPIAIVYWLIIHELTLDVIQHSFSWFFKK